ncbi:hypothetical protein CBF68_06590 [Lactobacillus taiwanensis]|uniref:hypothetical protein n=1 Tax=Lactobacillus taiwanensis TaxID=508451 RepID=UPI000B984610|nr:hypothetical protein [Lactobacillus taiwanensis]OYS00140.1 hypothetical protein CBF64_02340 [Lactobacillus taiwanensis]OYS03195.1 hypothetical protein CBF68_06590 [Lactobacillus taiwanensis]
MSLFNKNDQHNSGGYNIQNNIDNSYHQTNLNYPSGPSTNSDDEKIYFTIFAIITFGAAFLKGYQFFSAWFDKWFIVIFLGMIVIKILEIYSSYKRNGLDGSNVLESFLSVFTMLIWKFQNENPKIDRIITNASNNFMNRLVDKSNETRFGLLYVVLRMLSMSILVYLFLRNTWVSLVKGRTIKWKTNLWYLLPIGLMVFAYVLLNTI